MHRLYNKKHLALHSHLSLSLQKSAFVDVYGNTIYDENGKTVNRYRGLRSLLDSGKIFMRKDISYKAGPGFTYFVTSESQKNEFDEFRKTGKTQTRERIFHVYLDPENNGDLKKRVIRKTDDELNEEIEFRKN